VAAVDPLLKEADGWFESGELKRAVRAAVDAIQARLTGAEVGGLSLVDDQRAGALSLAEAAGSGETCNGKPESPNS